MDVKAVFFPIRKLNSALSISHTCPILAAQDGWLVVFRYTIRGGEATRSASIQHTCELRGCFWVTQLYDLWQVAINMTNASHSFPVSAER